MYYYIYENGKTSFDIPQSSLKNVADIVQNGIFFNLKIIKKLYDIISISVRTYEVWLYNALNDITHSFTLFLYIVFNILKKSFLRQFI